MGGSNPLCGGVFFGTQRGGFAHPPSEVPLFGGLVPPRTGAPPLPGGGTGFFVDSPSYPPY